MPARLVGRVVIILILVPLAGHAESPLPPFFSQLSYMTYVGPNAREKDTPLLAKYLHEMAGAGVKTFVFVSDLGNVYGYSPTVWPAPNQFDFTYLDRHVKTILDAAGPDTQLILQLYIDAPAWWCEQHPNAMMVLDNGKTTFADKYFALPRTGPFPSIASPEWRDDMDRLLREVVAHVNLSSYANNVVGYQATGLKTQEWYHWSMNTTPELGDYSPPMLAAYRAWLKQHYHDNLGQLQTSWQQSDATFENAQIPSHDARIGGANTFRDPAKEQPEIDFHRFWSWIMADTIGHFCDTLRGAGAPNCGAFYGYSAEFAHLAEDAGHLALPRGQPAPDYMMAPTSYFRRGLGEGQALLRSPRAGDGRPRLVPWCDFDAASYLIKNKDQAALAPWIASMGVTNTAEEFTWNLRRQWTACRANGAHMALFDLHGGYYDDPDILREVGNLEKLSTAAGPLAPGGGPAEIIVVLDEDSCHFVRFRDPFLSKLLVEQIAEFPFVAPFAFHVGPLESLPPETKLVVYLNQFKLDEAERARQHAMLRDRHATALYLYAPGYFTDDGISPNVDNITKTLGMTVAKAARRAPGSKITIEGSDVPLLDADQFVIKDPTAETLAPSPLPEGGAAIAQKTTDGVPTLYAATAPLPRGFLRKTSQQAGVHLLHDRPEDSIYYDGRYLALAAGKTPGPRTLTLPYPAKLSDAETGDTLGAPALEFHLDFKPLEVRIFRVD